VGLVVGTAEGMVAGANREGVVDVVVDLGVSETSCEGVMETSWKMPFTAWKTTTTAGALLTVP
jgi:hypothetical protein